MMTWYTINPDLSMGDTVNLINNVLVLNCHLVLVQLADYKKNHGYIDINGPKFQLYQYEAVVSMVT